MRDQWRELEEEHLYTSVHAQLLVAPVNFALKWTAHHHYLNSETKPLLNGLFPNFPDLGEDLEQQVWTCLGHTRLTDHWGCKIVRCLVCMNVHLIQSWYYCEREEIRLLTLRGPIVVKECNQEDEEGDRISLVSRDHRESKKKAIRYTL